jgi:hypothetical protein
VPGAAGSQQVNAPARDGEQFFPHRVTPPGTAGQRFVAI